MRWRLVRVQFVGIALLVASMAFSIRFGAAGVTLDDLGRTVGGRLGLSVEPLEPLRQSLIWDLRVPRVMMAALVGAALAVGGAVLQAITRNILADPYLLGVSSGASVGAVVVVVVGVGAQTVGVAGGAFIGSLGSLLLLLGLLHRSGLDSARLVLTGVVVAQLCTALMSLILVSGGDGESTRAILFWLLGSMSSARWGGVGILFAAATIAFLVIVILARSLDSLSFGADTAESVGVNVRSTRWIALMTVTVLTAVAVASVGAIGFVGLIVPHAVRFLVGPLHSALLPTAALAGAIFLVWTDTLARVAFAPQEIPVGVFTALIGVPIFLAIMQRRERV